MHPQNDWLSSYPAPSSLRVRQSGRPNRQLAICFCALWVSVASLPAQTPLVSFAGVRADLHNIPGSGRAVSPQAISVDGAGDIFVSELSSSGVARISTSTGFQTQLLPPFWSVQSMAADPSGNAWVSAASNDGTGWVNHLVKIDLAGVITEINAGGAAYAVTADLSGNVYYSTEAGPTNVIPSGSLIPQLFSNYGSRSAMAVDQAGNLFFIYLNTVMKAPLGCYSPSCSPGGPPPIPPPVTVFTYSTPSAIALDRFGNLFIEEYLGDVWELPAGCTSQSCSVHLGLAIEGGFAVNANGDIFTSGAYSDVTAIQFRAADFYGVSVGSSRPLVLNFTINSAVTLGPAPVALTQGISGLDFLTSGTTCAGFQAAGNTCTTTVYFSPQAPGLRMGSIEIKDSAGNTLLTVPLRGVGTGPAVAFAGGPQTAVAQGAASDVAVDPAGNIFITDSIAKAVLKVAAGCTGSNCQTTVATGFADPLKLAVDGDGAIFVADTGSNRVVKISPGCTTTACQTTVGSGLLQPDGVALDGWGNVYISDFGHQRIVVARDNCSGSSCQATVISGVNGVEGLALSTSSDIFVAQTSTNQLALYPGGCAAPSCATTIGIGFPAGVALTAGRAALATNSGASQVVEVPWNCKTPACLSTASTGAGPFGVTLDSVGNIFAAYVTSREVDKVTRTGPPVVALPTTFVTHKSGSQTVTLENIGNDRLDFSSFSASASFGVDPSTTTCRSFLAPGVSCSIGVFCAPVTGGNLTGTLTIRDTALNQFYATHSVPLTCTVTGSLPQVSFTGAPAGAQLNSTFTVIATTNASSMPLITGSGGCSVTNVTGTPASTTATVTMTSATVACSLSASWAEDSNYAAATLAQTTLAQLLPPTVTFTGAPASAKVYTSFTVFATSNTGTTPVITTNTLKCQVAQTPSDQPGTIIAMLSGTGNCIVTATWAATGNYASAQLSQSVAAQKTDPQLVFSGAPSAAAYRDTFTVTAVTSATTQAVITTTGSCSNVGITVTMTSGTGTCTIKADWAADSNYLAASATQTTIAGKGTQTITFTPGAPSLAPFNSSFQVAASSNSGLPVALSLAPASAQVCSLSGSTVLMLTGTGTCTINADQAGDANFNAAAQRQTSASASRIDQAALVVNAASPLTFQASENVSATGGTLSGSPTFSVPTGSCSVSGGQLTANSGTGSCVVQATKSGNANYNDATGSATVTLTKAAQTITFSQPASPVSYGATFSAPASSTSGLAVLVAASGGCSITGGTVTMTSGSVACVLTASQPGDTNYQAAGNVVRTVNASLSALTITADPKSKQYLSALPAFSVSYSGFKGADTASVLTGVLACTTTATTASTIGNYPITCSGLTTPNYSINWTAGQLSVLPLPLVSTVTLSSSTAQYSDNITIAVSLPNPGGVTPAAGMNFKIGSVDLGTVPISANGANFTGSILSQQLLQAPGSYTITASFVSPNANYALSSAPNSLGLTITPEDARSAYTGAAYFSTPSATTYTATIPLSFTIYDITAVGPFVAGTSTTPGSGDQAYDPWPGNAGNATVQVVDALTNTTLCATTKILSISSGANTTVTATCSFTANLPTSGASAGFQTYAPQVVVGGYYFDAEAVTEQSLITVALPLTSDFVSASGSLSGTASSGLLPAAPGSKMHFGLNVKYNKSGTNLQGNAIVIVRSTVAAPGDTCLADVDGYHVYRIKSNSITSATTQASGSSTVASILGNASIIDVTSNGASNCSYSVDGGTTLQITMTDKGGSGDTIGITVWQASNKGGGLWFSTNWVNGKTVEFPITNGNISVH